MNGNEPAQHPDIFDHEVRITRLEEAVKSMQRMIEDGFAQQRAQIRALEERIDRNNEALRQEFHRDRRFSAFVFVTTQLAVIGALLKLANVL